jgi:hypothetical protein
MMNIRLNLIEGYDGRIFTKRTGPKELQRALWGAFKTVSCSHSTKPVDNLKLPPGCVTIGGLGAPDSLTFAERIIVCLTAHSIPARWRALVALSQTRTRGAIGESPQILLRGNTCCFQCAIYQAAEKHGRWYIVL